MHPAVRALGTLLRLVGISSPEDTATDPVKPAGPPSWRSAPPPTSASAPPQPAASSSTPPSTNPPSV
jgi:hypothetical protein